MLFEVVVCMCEICCWLLVENGFWICLVVVDLVNLFGMFLFGFRLLCIVGNCVLYCDGLLVVM